MVFHTRKARQREIRTENVCRWVLLATAFCAVFSQLLVTDSVMAQPSLFDEIGIGANWGPHWASGTEASQADVRDTQDDGAFPAEICLVVNAGFKTIRMYGENMETWIAVLDAVDDYNSGKLNCIPAAGKVEPCGSATKPCMSVVYQAGICGPDPSSLEWNGQYMDIEKVTCHGTGTLFAQSVAEETAKLKQILRYAGDKFAKWVPLVIVGNEIFYSRGVCASNTEQACTEHSDCGSGSDAKCNIQHFCSNELSSTTTPSECDNSSSCQTGGTCTDVTNFKAIDWAFGQVQATLDTSLPHGVTQPKFTISLQADVLTSPSFGDDWKTAELMYSRSLVKDKLAAVGKVLAVNVYPDQWGYVKEASGNSYPSCINEKNAVLGNPSSLPADCNATSALYVDSRTNLIAHSIADYLQLLNGYYQGLDILITETGWHTAGTCSDYNDPTSTYSPKQASAFYSALYKYAQNKQIPVLVFELFDQKTKSCVTSTASPAEANYGIFSNYCQIKGDKSLYSSFLPQEGPGSPGANLLAFQSLLGDNGSCDNQTLITVVGTGDSGVCYHNPELACQSGYPAGGGGSYACPAPTNGATTNPCVWGACDNGQRGCNPDDPANTEDGCNCVRSGVCANTNSPGGVYSATYTDGTNIWNAACLDNSKCNDAIAPFTTMTCEKAGNCGCYAELAPSSVFRTISENKPIEGPGFTLTYQNSAGTFKFNKTRTLSQKILGEASGTESSQVQTVWGNIFMGKDWKLRVTAPQGSDINGTVPEKTIWKVTPGTSGTQMVTWDNATAWTDYKYGGMPVGTAFNETEIHFPRGFLTSIPNVPATQANLTPYRPNGWPDKLVISKEAGTAKDQDTFYTTDSLYVDWAMINNDNAATAKTFMCALSVDGVIKARWKRSTPLKPGSAMSIKDFPLGRLSAGKHRIRIMADSTGVVQESDESDNGYTETITVKAK